MFNYLSGTSIDNIKYNLFDAFNLLESYIGFSRSNRFTWGENALVSIKFGYYPATAIKTWPDDMVDQGQGATTFEGPYFFDLNSRSTLDDPSESNREQYRQIGIFYTPITDADYDMRSARLINNEDIAINDGRLYLSYYNENWALIQNLSPLWYNIEPFKSYDQYKFYIVNYNKSVDLSVSPLAKIELKTTSNILTYNQECYLQFFNPASQPDTGESLYFTLGNKLEKSVNVLGETTISGLLKDDFIASMNSYGLKASDFLNANAYFRLVEADDNTNVLNNKMKFDTIKNVNVNTISSIDIFNVDDTSSFILLKSIINDVVREYKVTVGDLFNDNSLAIWHESYATNTARIISDANPPTTPVSLIKYPGVTYSIFDILGMKRIDKATELWYTKIIPSTKYSVYSNIPEITTEEYTLTLSESIYHTGTIIKESTAGSNKVYLNDNHNFVVGDKVSIYTVIYEITDVINAINNSYIVLNAALNQSITGPDFFSLKSILKSNVVVNDILIKTHDVSVAKKYDMDNVMIDVYVPPVTTGLKYSPTEDIYKQVFICLDPTYTLTNIQSIETSGATLTHEDLFDVTNHTYDIGQLKYVANKIPVLRKTITTEYEHFRIII
jgi:hypothetical protein